MKKKLIDASLARAVERVDVPGVVAGAASTGGAFYGGAFGTSDIATGKPLLQDALFFIASMTKAVTSVAVMQLVERDRLTLDGPLSTLLPQLGSAKVLTGFSDDGYPQLRPPRCPITLRHLLTHTAGFAYPHWNSSITRYVERENIPDVLSMLQSSLSLPLVSDPGEHWNYGISTDYVGKVVEAVTGQRLDEYFAEHIFAPLQMQDTFYSVPPAERHRIARVHARQSDGTFEPFDIPTPSTPEFYPGGVGLFSTAGDYLSFARMILGRGMLSGVRILEEKTVDAMSQNHLGSASIEIMTSHSPLWSKDVDLFPGQEKHWGLGFMINTQPSIAGRAAGSLAWAGACNTFFWVDPTAETCAVFMTQVVPFCDERALKAFHEFECLINNKHSR